MDYRNLIFSRKDLKIIIIGTVIGGVLQVICRTYLKNHPELLNNNNSEKVEPLAETKKPGLRRFFPRGGMVFEFIGAKLVINIAPVISYVATKGALTGVILTATGVGIKKIPITTVSTVVRNALPTSHSDLEKNFILVDGKKISLDQCDQTFEYLFKVLSNRDIPFDDKKEVSLKILMNHLDLGTTSGRVRFIFCILSILHIFSIYDTSSYFIMMRNLIKAIEEGKISKRLARVIIRRLIKLKIEVDPELINAAA